MSLGRLNERIGAINGFGRLGKMFGCEIFDITPDMPVLSKQITSSYMPLAALLFTDEIYEAVADNSQKIGTFGHGFTASGHPVALAVAMENLDIYEERDLLGHVQLVSPVFLRELKRFADHPLVGEARGIGLIGAVELVADKKTKAGFDRPGSVGAYLLDRAHAKLDRCDDALPVWERLLELAPPSRRAITAKRAAALCRMKIKLKSVRAV